MVLIKLNILKYLKPRTQPHELAVNANQRPEPNRRRLSKGACLVNYRPAEHLRYQDTTSTLGLSLGYATLTQLNRPGF